METTKIPEFISPTLVPCPQVQNLLHERFILEAGLDYYTYKILNPSKLDSNNNLVFFDSKQN